MTLRAVQFPEQGAQPEFITSLSLRLSSPAAVKERLLPRSVFLEPRFPPINRPAAGFVLLQLTRCQVKWSQPAR
jgi:hypothetical protein